MSEPSDQARPAEEIEAAGTNAASPTPPEKLEKSLRGRGFRFDPWLLVALLALALAAWQWNETRVRLVETRQELARRLTESEAVVQENQRLQKQTQDQLAALRTEFGKIEARLAESKSQQERLADLYKKLAQNGEEWALAEIEQNVTLAAQQLQLFGNVQGALLALQAADTRLAGNERPQYAGLRKVLLRDLDRLRLLPQIDLPGVNMRLESVILAVGELPLLIDARPIVPDAPGQSGNDAAPAATESSPQDFLRQMGTSLWRDLRDLFRIRRFDRHEPALLTPEQDFFLRENLKLRLLNARLALLARDQWTFHRELGQAFDWLRLYFDAHDKRVALAIETLDQVAATEFMPNLPNLNESLSAIKNFKLGKEFQ